MTTHRLLPTEDVSDDLADAETLLVWTPDRRWRSWTCPACGCTQASYHLPRDLPLCAGCVRRRREGKALLSAFEVWQEVLASPEVKAAGASGRPEASASAPVLPRKAGLLRLSGDLVRWMF
ncbi:hypothetical protein KCV87_12580 [Actinosynnema pretiosum subsp. pretiosum]|uniref:Uncharacterized protein n=2 Tax=Actinosynnema TaxID=40566 RepID=C6WBF3_ACTMD|nr:hypothetical protein [Actinosynnema mirum]ACU35521.1 hypothetical protein Amir_1572 [Actinosynnema mirum DSM 43827]AXX28900.1 hypothetical protein APASM_1535 [Actinosynnema pretiosum subsp. pretiosum]QUF06804.1 hypothetical protein KCV87_12580 [Actinosynnema pretiosum subsp. pretiosum]